MPLEIGLCIPLNELLVHGWDIRRCLGDSREPDAGSAELLVPYLARALSALVAPEAVVQPLSLNVGGQHWRLDAGPRGVQVGRGMDSEASLQAVSLKADPATFLLFVWGRIRNEHGATGILALRCHEASGRWDQIWQHTNTQISVA